MGVLQITESDEVLSKIGDYYVVSVLINTSEINPKLRDKYASDWICSTTAEWIQRQYIINDLKSSLETLTTIIVGSITNIYELGVCSKKYHTNLIPIPSGHLSGWTFRILLENGLPCASIYLKNKQ